MDFRPYLHQICDSEPADWVILRGPILRHGFFRRETAEGKLIRVEVDAPPIGFALREDVSITLLYGFVMEASVDLPMPGPFRDENCRAVALDCFLDGGLVHREILLKVDRQRCILPCPPNWTQPPQLIPTRLARLARLIHTLAGPYTDFDEYFDSFPMREVDLPWP